MRFFYYFFYFIFFGWLIGLAFDFFSFSRFIETIKKQPRALNFFQGIGALLVAASFYIFPSDVTGGLFLLYLIGQFVFIMLLPIKSGGSQN